MKAYTLRIEDSLLDALKHISIEEHKTVREILLEAVRKKISEYKNQAYFYTSTWQKEELSAKQDINNQRVTKTKDLKALFKELDA